MLLGLFSAVVLGCVGDPPAAGDAGKMTGEEGGPCFSDFTCKTGLVCERAPNTCVKPDASVDGGGVDTGGVDASADAISDGDDGGVLPCLTGTMAFWNANNNSTNDFFAAYNLVQKNSITFSQGMVATAFKFTGGYLVTAGTSQKLGGHLTFTLEFWIRWATSTNSRKIIFYGPSGVHNWQVMNNGGMGNDFLDFGIQNGGSISAQVKQDGQFHHVAFTLTAGQVLRSYIDGMPGTSNNSQNGALPMGAGYVALGADDTGNQVFDGELDEVAVYNRDLSAQEIKDTFLAGSKGRCRQ